MAKLVGVGIQAASVAMVGFLAISATPAVAAGYDNIWPKAGYDNIWPKADGYDNIWPKVGYDNIWPKAVDYDNIWPKASAAR